jgi:sugar phosphate permease
MVALALAGIGIGTTVVPITSSVRAAVPPERSGMAASASNTSREIGAVTGVAVLGSLVYSQLHASLVTQMNHLGVPPSFQGLVVTAIETGAIPKNTTAYAGFGKLVQEVIGAAYTAFHNGLHAALYLSAGLALAAGLLALITLRSHPVDNRG